MCDCRFTSSRSPEDQQDFAMSNDDSFKMVLLILTLVPCFLLCIGDALGL